MDRRPLIAITTYVEPVKHGSWTEDAIFSPKSYLDAVERAGAASILVAPGNPEALDVADGLVVIGGPDVDPARYGAEPHRYTDEPRTARDDAELVAINHALDRDLPLLAICRGLQLMNVALGGTLHQHLEEVVGHTGHLTMVGEMNANDVTIVPGSQLSDILGATTSGMCHHHQAIAELADALTVSATAADGTVEAVEVPGKRFAIAVQWHPEEEPGDNRLFDALVTASRNRENRG